MAVQAFHERGVEGVGMEEVAQRAQVSKRTLYRHFPDKGRLLEDGLADLGTASRRSLEQELRARADDPRGQLLALFDVFAERMEDVPYLGCPFVNATVQTAHSYPSVRPVAQQYKEQLRAQVARLAAATGAKDPDLLAQRVMIVLEGAIASAAVASTAEPAWVAREIAAMLVDHHLTQTRKENR